MIRIAAVYPRTPGKKFDLNYYLNTHLPMVQKKFGPYGLRKIEVDNGLTTHTGGESPFFAIGYLYFDTLADFQKAYKAVGSDVVSNISKYTDVKPMIQVGEIINC